MTYLSPLYRLRPWPGRALLACLLTVAAAGSAYAQRVEALVHTLDNGMKFLLVPRKGDPNVSCGWVAKVGSVNERPGITGVAHLFEHMMFKGTHTLGTTDIDKDLETISKLDAAKAQIRLQEEALNERLRLGLIDDPKDPANRTDTHKQLLDEFQQLLQQQRELIVKNEFDRVYKTNGASGLNAYTTNDFTAYIINVPSNKLELWFWMESDRLAHPVFREFYSERDVVREERRMRTESTPTGQLDEQFNALFWQSSPYHWPVIGWPSDLDAITREEALSFFSTYYAPNNLTVALVGDFDPEQVIEWAESYFGRLKRGAQRVEPVRTREVQQQGEARMIGYAATRPSVRIRYHTVADGHRDEPAFIVLSNILNGRTGRLHKSLVLEQQVATGAGGGLNGLKYDGFFQLMGIARQEHTPEEVEQALYKEMDVLREQLIGDHELQKVKNQQLAGDFRRLRSKAGLMHQLMAYEALGRWENINSFSERIQAVTADDVREVVRKYFRPNNRTVAIYYPLEQKDGQPAAPNRRPPPAQGGQQ